MIIKGLIKTWSYAFITLTAALLFFLLVIQLSLIPSNSMSPLVPAESIVISSRMSDTYNRGDIIIFNHDGKSHIKRIIGTGGDYITFKNGKVYVNSEEEHWAGEHTAPGNHSCYTVPNGMYFVLGDNRDCSIDSRQWDNPFVCQSEITGKSILSITLNGSGKIVNKLR